MSDEFEPAPPPRAIDLPPVVDLDSPEFQARLAQEANEELPLLMPFFIENWSPGLRAISVQTEILELFQRQGDDLIKIIEATWDDPHDPWSVPWAVELAQMLEVMIGAVGNRAFIRLGSRSPKDNPLQMNRDCIPIPAYTGRQAVEFLSYSERVLVDLMQQRRALHRPSICVRRWIDMDTDQEFRCFIENREIVGITQYYLDHGYSSWIGRNVRAIEGTLRDYLSKVVLKLTHLSSLTVDVILTRDMRPTLLEINPPVTSGIVFPGLFRAGGLDGSFRFVKPGEGKPANDG